MQRIKPKKTAIYTPYVHTCDNERKEKKGITKVDRTYINQALCNTRRTAANVPGSMPVGTLLASGLACGAPDAIFKDR